MVVDKAQTTADDIRSLRQHIQGSTIQFVEIRASEQIEQIRARWPLVQTSLARMLTADKT